MPVTIPRYGAVGFSIDIKGYVCTGSNMSDVWAWNSQTNTWTQKANFPGGSTTNATSFVVDSLGYIIKDNDLWMYSPVANTWMQKASFPGIARTNAAGFATDTLGFICTGFSIIGNLVDLWQYNPNANTWIQRADFPGCARTGALGISQGNKVYLGFGQDSCNLAPLNRDWWKYDPINDMWIQLPDLPADQRYMTSGFAIGNKLYIGTGWIGIAPFVTNDFWEYDTTMSTWTQMANFGGGGRNAAVGFSIGNKGYIATGKDQTTGHWDLWEFTPPPVAVNEQNKSFEIKFSPNPFNKIAFLKILASGNHADHPVQLKIFSLNGQEVSDSFQFKKYEDGNNLVMTVENISSRKGIYIYEIEIDNNVLQRGKFVIQ